MKIAVGIDNAYGVSADRRTAEEFCAKVRSAGHEVIFCGVGPSVTQNYARHNNIDVMVQIAGGICLCTLCDFIAGIEKGYYNAKKACIPYFGSVCADPETWKAGLAWDDNFCSGYPLQIAKKYFGKSIYDVQNDYSNIVVPFHKKWKTGAECAEEFLRGLTGGVSTNSLSGVSTGGSSGGTAFDYIKEVCNEWNEDGIDITLTGDTLKIKHATTKEHNILPLEHIINDSATIEEYDAETPNHFIFDGKVENKSKDKKETAKIKIDIKDQLLIDKYEEKKETIKDTYTPADNKTAKNKDGKPIKKTLTEKKEEKEQWVMDKIHVLKRGHGHTIDLKTLVNSNYTIGKWIQLNIQDYNINDLYYITKTSYENDNTLSLCLEPGVPDRKVELQSGGTGVQLKTGNINKGRITSIIEKCGGVTVTDPKTLYNNFLKFKYSFYSNDIHSLDSELQRIQSGQGLNCVDSAQLYYQAYKECGFTYPIRIVNTTIQCSQSYGHVFCEVQINGKWEIVDPSAAADHKKPWGSLICGRVSGGKSYDQAMWLSDDGRT